MRRGSKLALAGATAALLLGPAMPVPVGAAVPLGEHLVMVTATQKIVTGDTWQVTVEVDDVLGQPVAGTNVWTGIVEPSTGCGGDLTVAACTDLATVKKTTGSDGRVSLSHSATLDTFLVFYLSDSQNVLDPTTGVSTLVRTHNRYVWSGPSSVTLKQYAIGKAPYALGPGQRGNAHRIAEGRGAAGAPLTEVSTDGGKTWTIVGRGNQSGAFAIRGDGAKPVNHVNLMASKAGTYHVRITDSGGTYEDPGASQVVKVVVKKRSQPGWLRRTNLFRKSLGLAPVADNPVYDAAVANHVHWMNIHNSLDHSESAGSTGYTKSGDAAGAASVLEYGSPTQSLTVDGWIGAPFHATCLLNAYWAVGGFAMSHRWAGEWCHSSLQTLDLARGVNSPLRSTLRSNYTYPSATMAVPRSVTRNYSEAPDPVASCGGRLPNGTWSVPVIFRVAKPPAGDRSLSHATAVVRTKSGRRISSTCLLTAPNFHGSDSFSTEIARLILGDSTIGRWAIVLTSKQALKAGNSYTATLTDGNFTQRTAFKIARH